MIRVREAILVEGRHDMTRLQGVVDAPILQTRGFRIFKDPEQTALLRHLAARRGLIILTDSDSAGFVIRNYISGIIPADQIKQAYIPPIEGRESRKSRPSKEGLLGVEGMTPAVLLQALRRAGATILDDDSAPEAGAPPDRLTTWDLYQAGLTGRTDSGSRREALLANLEFPRHMTAGRLLAVLNAAMTPTQFYTLISQLFD